MIFSIILSNIDNRDIGLKLLRSCVEPPLCIGIVYQGNYQWYLQGIYNKVRDTIAFQGILCI